jgi:hypothetical protein
MKKNDVKLNAVYMVTPSCSYPRRTRRHVCQQTDPLVHPRHVPRQRRTRRPCGHVRQRLLRLSNHDYLHTPARWLPLHAPARVREYAGARK